MLERALAANDRVKYLIALAQAARLNANAPDQQIATLRAERVAAGVHDETLDEVVGRSAREAGSIYRIPGAERLVGLALGETREMLAPLRDDPSCAALVGRLTELAERVAAVQGDHIAAEQLAALTSADPDGGDSLHLLVMDAHRALNQLHRRLATEVVEGAHVFGIEPSDRSLVAAFMQGVQRTEALRLEHPHPQRGPPGHPE
jgi:hypothetical protein